ncbi:serine hydrolase [Streptomyces sp. VRA16 Mangrove soil]|uniref:serine hydrolase domain-containing protein n=1 Tax=Streptomyces sp. VRA16 Mangrove soil TaxID=2817434 RepID=UPI001A9E5025|nr:serine hydrolase domain-containing protein [Streptomyces sp. VRA16 Mangrove soil]MBO1330088.1 beta-lactamase family protein [Streptomyces sp. VRA16 Mangrove soil]
MRAGAAHGPRAGGASPDLAPVAGEVLRTGGPVSRPAGVCLGVLVDGKDPSVAATGRARLPDRTGPGEPMTTGLLFDLASVTKVAATTAVVMRLVAAGLLDPDAPVRRHLPGFRGNGKDRVTVAQLLAHRGGLAPWWPLYCRTTDREEALDLVERLPLEAPPGARRAYSDLGFMLLGRIVERITGAGLDAAFRRRVAEPLGLVRTRFGPVDPAASAVGSDGDGIEATMVDSGRPYPVPCTSAEFTGWRTAPVRGVVADGNAAHALAGVGGHAGLFAPLDELLRLGAALVHDDSFVPAAVRARFQAPADPRAPEQALGWRRFTLPAPDGPIPMVGHGGFTGTHLAAATDRPLVVALAATRLHGACGAGRDALVPVDLLARRAHLGTLRVLFAPQEPS